ncbi:MAG: hypothetical protein A4S09_12985 [Proteobacteria bacterium SG_bin7]|nr:MAG: hypothetical protein A4S09_12985 [Proteobacteria bacterium SG_bin7]
MESAVLILVSGIIIAGVVLYSLIQLCKQLEIFILQSYESGESILAVIYGVVVIAGLVALFLLSSRSRLKGAKNSRVPIKHEPLEGIISGFVNGFYSGLKGEPTSHI